MQIYKKNKELRTVISLPKYLGYITTTRALTRQGLNFFESCAKKMTKKVYKQFDLQEENEIFYSNLKQAFYYYLLENIDIIDKEQTKITDFFTTYINLVKEIVKEEN